MKRLTHEGGLTLIELQIAMVLMLIVMGATLTTFNESEATHRVNQDQNDAQDQNRRAIDALARQLRNLASPSTDSPVAIERSETDDLIFKTVAPTMPDGSQNDANLSRVRYCLGQSAGGKETLLRQEQTWITPAAPPNLPMGATCPDAGWPTIAGAGTNAVAAAENLVNREQGIPVFAYDSGDPATVYSVAVELAVDIDPSRSPLPSRLGTSVFLRNQNQAPIASATATDTGTGHRVLLNGTASLDPEGSALIGYEWFADEDLEDPIATGVVAYWSPSGSSWPQVHDITLRVTDAGGRDSETTIEGVQVQ